MKLSEHFTLGELTKSRWASRLGVDNTPSRQQVILLSALCSHTLELQRAKYGPIIVTSGYRSPRVNAAVRGAKHSAHLCLNGRAAADIEAPAVPNYELARSIAQGDAPFDTVILEFAGKNDPRAGWVHVTHRLYGGPNRRRVLSAVKDARGRTKYVRGLIYAKG